MPPSVWSVGEHGRAIMLLVAKTPSLNRCLRDLSPCQSRYQLTQKKSKSLALNRNETDTDGHAQLPQPY